MASQVALAVGSYILSDNLRNQTPFQLKAPETEPVKKLISPVEASKVDILLGTDNKKQEENSTVYNLRKPQSLLGTKTKGGLI